MRKTIVLGVILLGFLAAGVVWAAGQMGEMDDMVRLGRMMYQDRDFSLNRTQSCMTCHHQRSGFADPRNSADPDGTPVSLGDDGVSLGGRNAPTAAYAGFSPLLEKDADGNYFGGMFWDGHATGLVLGDPFAEQAQGPPLNPVEMNMPDEAAVVAAIAASQYADLFLQVFGYDPLDDTNSAYDDMARAIAAYERSSQVQRFSSKFDKGVLNDQEQVGQALFEANCAKCHSMAVPDGAPGPVFTNYGYENIGVPVNPRFEELGIDIGTDLGLGGFLETDYNSEIPLIGDAGYDAQYGKFKIPTLRNVALTAPYGHNGSFATLTEMVQFHNTRDVEAWDPPEVADNLNTEDVGDMGLTDDQVAAIVAFLNALSDGAMTGM
jgi:cytochrome c peroxidase